jgi:hypothetical protein
MYDWMEAIPPGSTIALIGNLYPAEYPETGYMYEDILWYCAKNDIKIIAASFGETFLVTMFNRAFSKVKPDLDAEGFTYGEDIVYCFFPTTHEGIYIAFAEDFFFAGTDYEGTVLTTLPLMQTINNIEDVYGVVMIGTIVYAIRHMIIPFDKPGVAHSPGFSLSEVLTYYPAFLSSVTNGLKGAAEFEFLIGHGNFPLGSMDMLSMVQIYLIVLVIIGNVLGFMESSKRKR